MEELQVNDYIRTRSGKIDQVIRERFMGKYVEGKKGIYLRESIKKYSKNIIDLVEENDIVNGKIIHKIDKRENSCYLYYGNCKTLVDYQIKTILTHELYEDNCYKVGGEDEF